MSDLYCQNCGDPVETGPMNKYKSRSPIITRHIGESYLMTQSMSGLNAEDREQLKAWGHPIVVVDGSGKPMSANFDPKSKLGRQFR
jgi:hypothetical protein